MHTVIFTVIFIDMQYRFTDCVLDTARFSLVRAGERVEIEPQVLRFLVYLIENRERVISRDELLNKMFGQRIVTDNALTVRIRAARRAVGDTGNAQAVIATFQGHGYRFVAKVETSSQRTTTEPTDTAAQDPSEALLMRLGSQPSIAILPFEMLTAEEQHQTIARGLTYDLITRVAYCRTMFVIARGSAFQFPSGQHDVREVGEKLGVRYVCQGAVQVSGSRVRVSVGLADARSRAELWSEQFDRPLLDVLDLQEDIAGAISASLEYAVQRNEMRLAAQLPATNLDAWSAFHRGLDHMYRFRISECDAAERFFRHSIDLEPGLARPCAGLSFVNYERGYLNLDGNRDNWLRRSFDYAHRAVDTDPLDPMGYWALSRACFLARDLESARKAVAVATELSPSYASAQYLLGWIAMQTGDRELCEERISLACRLSPHDPLIYGMQGVSALNLALMGRTEEAMQRARQALLHPDIHYQANAFCVVIFAISGRADLAAEQLKLVHAVDPNYDVDEFLSVYAFQQDTDIDQIRRGFKDAKRLVS